MEEAHNSRTSSTQENIYYKITTMSDAGDLLHSPSAELMKLVDVEHLSDFDQVVGFLSKNLDNVISEVHNDYGKLLIDNQTTQLNCPPVGDVGDSHGGLLLKTLSEVQGPDGVLLKREFKVHDLGRDPKDAGKHQVEIREDMVLAPHKMGDPPVFSERVHVASLVRP